MKAGQAAVSPFLIVVVLVGILLVLAASFSVLTSTGPQPLGLGKGGEETARGVTPPQTPAEEQHGEPAPVKEPERAEGEPEVRGIYEDVFPYMNPAEQAIQREGVYRADFYPEAPQSFTGGVITYFSQEDIERRAQVSTHQGYLLVDNRDEFKPTAKVYAEISNEIKTLRKRGTPESEQRASELEMNLQNELNNQREKIHNEQNRLLRQLGLQSNRVRTQTANVLNMMSFPDMTDEEKERLESSLPEGVSLSPNMQVEATLHDSVPLINATDVWGLNEYGGPCLKSAALAGLLQEENA
jgi:hypothetical protein